MQTISLSQLFTDPLVKDAFRRAERAMGDHFYVAASASDFDAIMRKFAPEADGGWS